MGMDERMAKMAKNMDGADPAPFSVGDSIKGRKAAKFAKREQTREKKEVKNLAAKSMDVSNWKVEDRADDQLAAATVGWVTYDQLKAQKELLVNGKDPALAAVEAKRKADETEVVDRKAREIGNLLPNNRRQRRTCYALCHILYPVSAAHTRIFRMDSNSTSYRSEGQETQGRPVKSDVELRPRRRGVVKRFHRQGC
jgi:hypothetical protein